MNTESISTIIQSPLGPLLLTASPSGVTGLVILHQQETKEVTQTKQANSLKAVKILSEATQELEEYFNNPNKLFKSPLVPSGTPFQHRVWEVLRQIPAGQTMCYSEVAKQCLYPKATRAVARAIGQNPIGILVPCHRVIGKHGDLTGYAGGLKAKKWLLLHEQVSFLEKKKGNHR